MNVSTQADGNVVIKGVPIEWSTCPSTTTTLCISLDTAVVLRDLLDAWDDARIREEQSS